MRLLPLLRTRLREESGSTLIEVMMSAMLVAMLAVGVLKGLDAAGATSGNTKNRAVAADLAQQDQERLRSFRAKELSNARETRTRTVAGVPYEVVSASEWVTDDSGTRSCTSSSTRADYMKIRSTVTWPSMQTKAVTVTSLMAAPNGSFGDEGSLGVQVLDRTGSGVQGVGVEVSGPKNVGGTTDGQGCVFFGYLTAGNYTVQFSKAGYVDANGNQAVVRPVGVQDEATQLLAVDYDLAGGAIVNVKTKKGTAAQIDAYAPYVSLGHGLLASPGIRRLGNGTPQKTHTASLLFPFTSPYAAFSGDCAGANPSNYGLTPGFPTVTPGGSPTVTVQEPAVAVRRFNLGASGATSALATNVRVVLTAKAVTCGGTSTWVTADSAGWLKSSVQALDQGVPYGIYDVCVDYNGRQRRVLARQIDGITKTGEPGITAADTTKETVVVPNNSGDPTGTCPA